MATHTPSTGLLRIPRRDDGKIVAGVCTGLGAFTGIDPNLLRIAFAVCSLAGGLGIFLYAGAWLLMAPPTLPEAPPRRDPDPIQAGALGVVVLGVLLLARTFGFWPGDVVVWPLAVAALGIALLWMRPIRDGEPDADGTLGWTFLDRFPPAVTQAVEVLVGTRRGAYVRIAGGAVLMACGIVVLLATADSWSALRAGAIAALVIVSGLLLVLGPGLVRLATELVNERRDRIRSDERADMAAHLHDSVLQTLALVQRRADDPKEVVRLARMQERELRAWLRNGTTPDDDTKATRAASFGAVLEASAATLEAEYGVPIEVVRVRDCPAAGLEPLMLAAREGMLNAVRHSGAPSVSVYFEARDDRAVVFVRDRGKGFDVDAVPEDRGGIAVSIVGRLERNGGRAQVRSEPGEGCELELTLPRRRHDDE